MHGIHTTEYGMLQTPPPDWRGGFYGCTSVLCSSQVLLIEAPDDCTLPVSNRDSVGSSLCGFRNVRLSFKSATDGKIAQTDGKFLGWAWAFQSPHPTFAVGAEV